MDSVRIQELEAVNPHDIRGLSYEWMKGKECGQLTLCYRKKNTLSGNHYHTGKDASKNPELVLLISGQLRLITCNGKDTIEQVVEKSPGEIMISPNILHTYKAISDIIFLEYRTSIYNPADSDTFPVEVFESYLKSRDMSVNEEAIKKFIEIKKSLCFTTP